MPSDAPKKPAAAPSSDSEESESIDLEFVDHNVRQRGAVSSEVPSSNAQNFKAPICPKTEEQSNRIAKIIRKSFLFANLNRAEFRTVLGAFEEQRIKENEELIHQGDEGDCLYLVEDGTFDVFKKLPTDEKPKQVNVMERGSTIGELALLYSSPRAATVIARTDAIVWKLDRGTFSNVVRTSAMRKRDQFTQSLAKVPLLRGLSTSQQTHLADALLAKDFVTGEKIVQEGEEGNTFFILDTGRAEASKNGKAVMKYVPGDYFGELALIRGQRRAATVKATEDSTCLILARESFTRLLGPLEDMLERNAALYSDIPLDERP